MSDDDWTDEEREEMRDLVSKFDRNEMGRVRSESLLDLGRRIERRVQVERRAGETRCDDCPCLWGECEHGARVAELEAKLAAWASADRIYLQSGDDAEPDPTVGGCTWCKDKINDSDAEFARVPKR